MNRCCPLALDDRQLGIVMAAACRICACDRDRFYSRSSNHLSTLDHFDDLDVQRAIDAALNSRGECAA